MPMTLVVTNDVPSRFRGFLASCMLEVAPGVYTAPRMTKAVRTRIWRVFEDWQSALETGWILMTWPDAKAPSGQAIVTMGTPCRHLRAHEGLVLGWSPLTKAAARSLIIDENPSVRLDELA